MIIAMPTTHANGLEIGYDVFGAGPPVVALHGATSAGAGDFAPPRPRFATALRL